MSKNFIFSSESVGEGHPDKVCDTISDAVLDACLAQDKFSRVACETYAKCNIVVVGGEITTKAKLDFNAIAREAIRDIGYTHDDDVFHADKVLIMNAITSQSPDIAQGVDAREGRRQGNRRAGRRRPGLDVRLRLQRNARTDARAHHVRAPARPRTHPHPQDRQGQMAAARRQEPGLRPIRERPARRHHQRRHFHPARARREARDDQGILHRRNHQEEFCRNDLLTKNTEFLINPTGRFVVGGPQGDTGLTGRKIIVDSYGGMGRHGGGAFSGKDPSKVDRSAAYMGRYVAKNIVAAGLADQRGNPVRLRHRLSRPGQRLRGHVRHGDRAATKHIEKAVREVFSFKPAAHHQATQPAPPDLLQDHQLRSLRQERSRHHLGKHRQGRGTQSAPHCKSDRST